MLLLRELQQGFAEHIVAQPESDSANDSFSAAIVSNGLPPEQRLRVYRNNLLVGMSKVLASTYPVTERLLGEDFFRFMAQQFIQVYPSHSGDLHDFGTELASFLCSFEQVAGLPYLPDVAMLELAYHQASSAADASALDTTALAQVPTERYEELKFTLHPSVRLLKSPYPVLTIWQVNQKDYQGDQTIDLAVGGEAAMTLRRDLQIELQALSLGEATLLQALLDGQPFADACEQAFCVAQDFDINASLSHHVVQGTLVDFYF